MSLFLVAGVTSTDDASFFIPSSSNTEDNGLLEELCETLILTIVMVLWKGIAGSDDEAWIVRIFSSERPIAELDVLVAWTNLFFSASPSSRF